MDKNKKQTVMLGVLLTVFLGVGAFSFIGGSKPPAAVKKDDKAKKLAETEAATKKAADDAEGGIRPEYMARVGQPYNERDPFNAPPEADPNATKAVAGPTPEEIYEAKRNKNNALNSAGNTPMPAVLPEGTVAANTQSGDPETNKPSPRPPHEPGEPPYRVVGTVAGVTPVAILEDDGGKQYFLKIGGSAGAARLISVSQRHVVIEYGGQNHTLSMGNY